MKGYQLPNDVTIGFLHQFMLVAGWPIEVRGLWFAELVLAVYSLVQNYCYLICRSYRYLLRRFKNIYV